MFGAIAIWFSGVSRLKYKNHQVRWRQWGGKRPAGNWHPPNLRGRTCRSDASSLYLSCDALSSGQQFPIATELFAHPMSIYWRDRLFSKMHYPSSHASSPKGDPTADILNTASVQRRPAYLQGNPNRPSTTWLLPAIWVDLEFAMGSICETQVQSFRIPTGARRSPTRAVVRGALQQGGSSGSARRTRRLTYSRAKR
jgi:hypothetical protein